VDENDRLFAFRFSLRAKLLLVSLTLLLIPATGLYFINRMEQFLRDAQQNVLLSAAKLLSASLSDRPALFEAEKSRSNLDDIERERTLALFESSEPQTAVALGDAYAPSADIERILRVVARPSSRIWVLDAHSHVRGLSGSLALQIQGKDDNLPWYSRLSRPMLRAIHFYRKDDGTEEPAIAARAVLSQVDRALIGQPTAIWRTVGAGNTIVLSAAQPIWQSDRIVGAVVVEESNRGNLAVTYTAVELLLAVSLMVFLVGFLAVGTFAWRLVYRIEKLRDEATRSIDGQGRIQGQFSGSNSFDELGELARALVLALGRLRQYNDYLEQLANRLTHELRTPVAVVRSSLDNLRLVSSEARSSVYLDRADEGVHRLSALISRLSEATQIDRFLSNSEKELFDLSLVVRGCVEGYRLAYPDYLFELEVPERETFILGVPDAVAQLLDKLVQNSVSYSPKHLAIRVSLTGTTNELCLSVENQGPAIDSTILPTLFSRMISTRSAQRNQDGHLGFGLYIVRLIADFHHARLGVQNLSETTGVRFEVYFQKAAPAAQ
jgi:signal transduction histidine kinase